MRATLPATTDAFLALEWAQIQPYFDELEATPLSEANLGQWMADWARVGKLVDEGYWYLWVQTTRDTLDAEAEVRFLRFLSDLQEPALAAEQRLKLKLLESGLKPDQFEAPMRNLRAQADLFREANLPLLTQTEELGGEYDRIRAAQTVTWNGEEITLVKLSLEQYNPDRSVRERAWRASMERCLADREAINEVWARSMHLRREIAANADLPNYRAYRWQQMLRLDYTPEDCERFHDAVERVVVPAAERVLERRRKRLGYATMRPWDVEVDASGRPPLHPFTDVPDLETKAARVLECLDPQLANYFRIMQREELLDLENHPGKMPSSYCATYPVQRRPYLFMNVVGTHDDVMTLFHELGHAFHSFENTHLPYHDQLHIGTEFHEVAAITMELLAAPYLVEGGFYTPEEAAHARITHLETMLRWWPYIAVVDAFQHWAHTQAEAACDPHQCDAKWAELWGRFMRGEDWSGLDDAMETGWHRKLHIFREPFYYIDYGLAQLGAVQIWARALENPQAAIQQYKSALALGGTVSLLELFEAAGARLAFDADAFAEAVDLIERTIDELSTAC
jgi:oligoendopeptidase F